MKRFNNANNSSEVILVPAQVLNDKNISNKRKGNGLIERLADVAASSNRILQDPSKYAIMIVSSRVAGPLAFDMLREIKKVAPGINTIIALEENGDQKSLQNLPFIDRIVQASIDVLDFTQIVSLADDIHSNNGGDEKQVLLAEIKSLGAEADTFEQLTTDQLRDLVAGLRKLIKSRRLTTSAFSEKDRQILNELVLSRGKMSSTKLSKTLGIPLTTLQRKRKRFENEFVETKYTLKYEKFGFRKAVLFLSTLRGNSEETGEKLFAFKEILAVYKSIGVQGIDLHAEVLVKNSYELQSLIDQIKSMTGVKDVIWSETVKEIGTNADAMIRVLKDA